MGFNSNLKTGTKTGGRSTIIFTTALLLSVCHAEGKLELKDQKDKESYSFGYQFGRSLKSQGLDLNLDTYVSGIRDALDGKEPQLSQEEIRGAIMEVQKRAMAARQMEMKGQGERNLSEGKAFMEANKTKEGVVNLPSGLQYKVLKAGQGKKPSDADTVEVQYRGTLINGKEFDSSYKRGKPASFKVNGVIKGWTEALKLMPVGSKWQLFIPPQLAYGERGAGSGIGPNATLIFELELLAIK